MGCLAISSGLPYQFNSLVNLPPPPPGNSLVKIWGQIYEEQKSSGAELGFFGERLGVRPVDGIPCFRVYINILNIYV